MNGRAWNSTLRPGKPLQRHAGLAPGGRLRPVSPARQAENRERDRMVRSLFPGALGDGQERPLCIVYALSQQNPGVVPGKVLHRCRRWADDVHEPLTRARGGLITDPGNATPPCRPCHDAIGSEAPWAYRLGLLEHSWGGDAA